MNRGSNLLNQVFRLLQSQQLTLQKSNHVTSRSLSLTFEHHWRTNTATNFKPSGIQDNSPSLKPSDILKGNPFYHEVKLTRHQWIVTCVCGVFLVPLRIALISVVFSVMWIPYHLVLRASGGLKHHKSPNLSKLEGSFVRWYFWMLCRAIGLSPKFEGEACRPEESRIMISAPHMTVFDFHCQSQSLYAIVSGYLATKWPLVGLPVLRTGVIVDKFQKESRLAAQEGIAQFLDERDRNPDLIPAKLAFAVEGWNTNGKVLLPFKTGAFKPGLPIQIFLPKWEEKGFVPIATYGQNISWFWTIIIALAQPALRVNVKMLPVYYPNEDEKNDPNLYAQNVAKLMSRETGIPLAEKTALEYLEEIDNMRDKCEELKTSGWKRLFTTGSEQQSTKKNNKSK